jgi:hypothetical protein
MTDRVRTVDEPPHPQSILATYQGARALASVLIKRLGGKVVITPEDFLDIAPMLFMESNEEVHTDAPDMEKLAVWIEDPRGTRQ